MSAVFSKTCEYALQAALFLARRESEEPIHLREMASALRIPHHFLSKILQTLRHYEIVQSSRGHTGGYMLARPPSAIHCIEIVQAIDGDKFLGRCVLGFSGCRDEYPCPMHSHWKEAKEIIFTMLTKLSIAELGADLGPRLAVLKDDLRHHGVPGAAEPGAQ